MMGGVDYSLVVDQFVARFIKNQTLALAWATKNINKDLFPIIKPMIKEKLEKKGYKFKAPEEPTCA
jgi:hypothetical protein